MSGINVTKMLQICYNKTPLTLSASFEEINRLL